MSKTCANNETEEVPHIKNIQPWPMIAILMPLPLEGNGKEVPPNDKMDGFHLC